MWTGSLLMTSPTATSSLFFGLATYGFLAGRCDDPLTDGGDFGLAVNERRGARPHVPSDEGGRARFRLDLPCERFRLDLPCEYDASENAGETVRAPVWARGRDEDVEGRGRFTMGGVTNDDAFEVTLLVRCLDENVVPNSDVELPPELDIGPETEREDDATDMRLELRLSGPVITDEPEEARRAAAGLGGGGTRNLPGDADSLEKLPFLFILCRGRGTSKLARIRGLLAAVECDELLMTEARLLRPELTTLAGRDFCPSMRSRAIASSSIQVCRMRSCSARTLGSSDRARARVFILDSTSRVKLRRADSCSSGGREGSDS